MKRMKKCVGLIVLLFSAAEVSAQLPDRALTPGRIRNLSLIEICTTKWGQDSRKVTAAMKQEVFTAYGFVNGNKDPRCPCEIDHLVSRELGGADDLANLWPQPFSGPWNARDKDRLENRLHKEICAGRMKLEDAQEQIRADWTKLFRKFFGKPKPQ